MPPSRRCTAFVGEPCAAAAPAAACAPAGSALADGTVIGDHFVIRRRLGGGGMGEVYLAENLNVAGKKYAIKVLRSELSADPRFVGMLQEEASKQSRLEHANVVGMYDFFAWAGHYCLVQSFVNGKTLAQMIAEQPQGLDRPQALSLMEGVLSGLDHAHAIGILHCDVKPANVIVDTEGRPRVTDFGISRDIGAVSGGTLGAGTPEYMSPEQISPPYAIDHRSDVFSAGVMFFEMLCGRLPFQADADAPPAVMWQLHAGAPDVRRFRPDVPEPLARIVATALQRDPAQRFQGCADFRKALLAMLRHERWRRTWLPALVVAGIAAIAGGTSLYVWREGVARESREAAERVRIERLAVAGRLRKTMDEAVHNAAVSFNLLCREAADYAVKRPGLEIALQSQDTQVVEGFKARLADMEGNMDRHAADYVAALQRLGATDPAVVAAALDAQPAADAQARHVATVLKVDEAAFRAGGTALSRDQLVSRCPPTVVRQ